MTQQTRPRPTVLVILDGWGVRTESTFNGVAQAQLPHYNRWWNEAPHATVETCAEHVGLPDGQMGNSEVGHMNLGAGRIVYQDFTRITKSVREGTFKDNPALAGAVARARSNGGAVHIFGLLSPGGVHSHTDHLLAAVALARDAGVQRILVHGFLDGRDTPPRSALEFIADFESGLARLGAGRIATLCGRYWAMDRDKRWERVQRAYDMLTAGTGLSAPDAMSAVQAAYGRDENDEFVQPTVIGPAAPLADGDVVLCMNFRADRVREITAALTEPAFDGFPRSQWPKLADYVTLTLYAESLQHVSVAFPPQRLTRILGEELSRLGLRQLRAAETEKYAHVTYFFNGGEETPFPGEDRLLIPSPKVATYDMCPEMSAVELTDRVLEQIASAQHDFICVNYANPDMVGHTGIFPAVLQALATVDLCLGRLAEAVLARGGQMLITSDHGNADMMVEPTTGQPHTAHTNNPGPLILLGRDDRRLDNGRLCDVAPTLLALMNLAAPPEMEGRSLLV
ncbi:MAG: 2,3-bisphosphoglycerate-independent phosphoglycerate mutase [Magnetococcus sp. WYHC-3]